jgi:3,4-dihydroxy 2-butanone 4-phosphate synthase/GTP cyclohydrolase II
MSAPTVEPGTRPVAADAALRAGLPVLLAGSAPATVLLAAATVTPAAVAWTIRHTSGLIRAVLPVERAVALRLRPMVGIDPDAAGLRQTAAVDAARGVTTGISAADRAHTLHVLAHPDSGPADLVQPGHVLVELAGTELCRGPAGELADAALALCAGAGVAAVAALAEIVDEAGEPAGPAALAGECGWAVVEVPDVTTNGPVGPRLLLDRTSRSEPATSGPSARGKVWNT